MKIKLFADEYQRKARFYPGILAMAPVVYCLFAIFPIEGTIDTFVVRVLIGAGVCCAISFLTQDLCRCISKVVFQIPQFSEDETHMPTTDLMLKTKTSMDLSRIKNIVNKIKKDFNVEINIDDNSEKIVVSSQEL